MTNPIKLAASAKGPLALLNRMGMIVSRYGLTPTKMDQALAQFVRVLKQFDCGATFPVTAVAVERHPALLEKYQAQGIEFAVHGYVHVDYSQLAPEEQLDHLRRALGIFARAGIVATGFRSPYLSRETHLHAAIDSAGFSYVSNQPVLWDVLNAEDFSPPTYAGYKRATDFYQPWRAGERPSLPHLVNRLVEIPVSLPDDEILVDRLGGKPNGLVKQTWQRILAQAHQQGELFTLQLHPERIARCADGLAETLTMARTLTPSVWVARLSEIAAWWRDRTGAVVEVNDVGKDRLGLAVSGPSGITVLARAVQVDAPLAPWADGYQQVNATTVTLHTPLRPFIGLSPVASPQLAHFMRQQGYIVETSTQGQHYSYYFDQTDFTAEQERSILAKIEATDRPLVRLSRWPRGARSALAVTGDIDALTLWDYGLRFLGR
jgi:peptidoglycan/xylan/chitin deacetylase (PgdA/CDA1 family)